MSRIAIEAETYRMMHDIAVNDLGYASLLEALEATPHADMRAERDEGFGDGEQEAHEWVRLVYREPDDVSQLDDYRFTRWNMAVAYGAGKAAGLKEAGEV